jgi:hypothetical protein
MSCFFRGFEFVRHFFTPSASRTAFGEQPEEETSHSQILKNPREPDQKASVAVRFVRSRARR